MSDMIYRADAIELFEKYKPRMAVSVYEYGQALQALPSAEAVQLKQTDTLIIADALRYLAEDEERHWIDRAKAGELRERILTFGASLSAEAVQEREQPDYCIAYGSGVCGYPIEACCDCPKHEHYKGLTEVVQCKDCKHQDECEEVVLFDVNDDEVMGHRLHWCSYGERREP